MYKALILAVAFLLAAPGVPAEVPAEKVVGIESKDYKWNVQDTEKITALRLEGNVRAGKEDYQAYCEACHLPSGGGNPDGSIPQLAGQHSTVIIKQLADIRSGLRYNPTMYPFARKLPDAQAMANVAAYIATLCVPRDTVQYEGPDAAKLAAYGKLLYDKDCVQCHQAKGDGVREKLYPVIAGQHYRYLLRQMVEIRDGKRRNSHPDMVRVIAKYDNIQLIAIAVYQSMLNSQIHPLTPQPHFCKPS